MVSADTTGMIEYWRGPAGSYCFPRNIKFDLKIDTDLYEFVKVSEWVKGAIERVRVNECVRVWVSDKEGGWKCIISAEQDCT